MAAAGRSSVPKLMRRSWPMLAARWRVDHQSGASLSGTAVDAFKSKAKQSLLSKITSGLKFYEDFIGITEVKQAQASVIQAKDKFTETQEQRRQTQDQIQKLQARLKEIHIELDKTARGEDRYLHLVTQEHALLRDEKQLIQEFQLLEKAERDYFSSLSLALQDSHEKERAQAEKSKYLSIIGSICGALIGILATSISNWMRMQELRGIVRESASNSRFNELVTEMADVLKAQHHQIAVFVAELKGMLDGDRGGGELKVKLADAPLRPDMPLEKLEAQTSAILAAIKEHDAGLAQEIKHVKALVSAQMALQEEGGEAPVQSAVYIGEDVGKLVKDAEKNLEWKMKINSLATVALVYGVFAVSFPIILQFLKGS